MYNVRYRQNKFAVTIFFILLLTACGTKSPETALVEFYAPGGAEDQIMDPLILAGDKVVPLVIEAVKDRNKPRRIYAIGFLGNGSYKQALPVLQEILQDNTENENFRSAALRAIYDIDKQLGASHAKKYELQDDYLGRQAKAMLKANSSLMTHRSYLDAWFGRHD
jgi:HEAT repeat protein